VGITKPYATLLKRFKTAHLIFYQAELKLDFHTDRHQADESSEHNHLLSQHQHLLEIQKLME